MAGLRTSIGTDQLYAFNAAALSAQDKPVARGVCLLILMTFSFSQSLAPPAIQSTDTVIKQNTHQNNFPAFIAVPCVKINHWLSGLCTASSIQEFPPIEIHKSTTFTSEYQKQVVYSISAINSAAPGFPVLPAAGVGNNTRSYQSSARTIEA
jgi:hypothetical protein